jgi:hypothetical protein
MMSLFQSPTHDGTISSSGAIIVPTADDDNGETREDDDVTQPGDGPEETDEGIDQGDLDSDQGQGQLRQQREVKFSDPQLPSAEIDFEVPDEESAEETAEEEKPGTPEGSRVVGKTLDETRFTLFAILPTRDVVTLRDVPSGSSVYNVQSLIELSGGIPSECYSLVTANTAERLSADVKLVLGGNITAGSTLRIIPNLAWTEMFRAIWNCDIEFIQNNGETHLLSNMDSKEAGEREKTYRDRLFLCLFMACAKGEKQMSQVFIEMGEYVQANGYF